MHMIISKLKFFILLLLSVSVLFGGAPAFAAKTRPAHFYDNGMVSILRIHPPILHAGSDPTSVIEDTGAYTPVVKGTDGAIFFSERGQGTKPLAIVGTPDELIARLDYEAKRGTVIRNQIEELRSIYMGITPYTPGKRFRARYPINDFVRGIVQGAADLVVPTSVTTDAITNSVSAVTTIRELRSSSDKGKDCRNFNNQVYLLKISYLQEDGMIKIGEGSVSFEQIKGRFDHSFAALHNASSGGGRGSNRR